jgi:hypothetical protein
MLHCGRGRRSVHDILWRLSEALYSVVILQRQAADLELDVRVCLLTLIWARALWQTYVRN